MLIQQVFFPLGHDWIWQMHHIVLQQEQNVMIWEWETWKLILYSGTKGKTQENSQLLTFTKWWTCVFAFRDHNLDMKVPMVLKLHCTCNSMWILITVCANEQGETGTSKDWQEINTFNIAISHLCYYKKVVVAKDRRVARQLHSIYNIRAIYIIKWAFSHTGVTSMCLVTPTRSLVPRPRERTGGPGITNHMNHTSVWRLKIYAWAWLHSCPHMPCMSP